MPNLRIMLEDNRIIVFGVEWDEKDLSYGNTFSSPNPTIKNPYWMTSVVA